MNKHFSLMTSLLLITGTAFAQDSVKKVQKKVIPVVAKPVYQATPAPYAYRARYAPAPVQTGPVDNSLNGQFNTFYKRMERWQQADANTFHKNFMDTLNLERRKLKEANAKLAEQTKTVAALQGDVSTKDQTLSQSLTKVNSIGFLGIPMSKSAYNVLMWGLVLVLGGGLAAVIFLSASSRREAAYRIQLHDELSQEFAAYKAKANEKEKKLARELQTERNKLDDLMGR